MNTDIVVYDPNNENPGGAELSAALAEFGRDIRWLLPEGTSNVTLAACGVDSRPVLAGGRPWTLRRIRRRMLGPFAFFWPVLRGRRGVVVWINDAWDGAIIALLGVIAPGRLYFIHNNPHSVRARPDFAAKLERFLVRRCHVIVHSEWLRKQAQQEMPHHVHVVAHPNYTLTAASAPPREPVADRVAYVGSLRRDKGAHILVEALSAVCDGFEFRTIGRGQLAEVDVESLKQHGISYVATGGLDQPAFLRELTQVQVVIAPYLQPTESGSVLLCMALGVPVLALDSLTMQRILNGQSRFETPAALGAGVARFLREPWPTFRLTPDQQRQQCRADLEGALKCQALSR